MRLLFFSLFVFFSLSSCKHEPSSNKKEVSIQPSEDNSVEYSAERSEVDPDKGITLIGNANFKAGVLEIQDADSLIYNPETGEIKAIRYKGMTFTGLLQVAQCVTEETLTYQLGDSIAYVY
ncbi:hypothetical protein V6R21_24035 [Limibacter armeniacum]|uniref:hypothetical protein n=1 Tax=Limibacter armeniacum TaxID=466084 RepID=UPI002FE6913E